MVYGGLFDPAFREMYFIIWIAQRVCRKIAKKPSFEMDFKALLVALFGKSLIE
jgi:hypothetical protein